MRKIILIFFTAATFLFYFQVALSAQGTSAQKKYTIVIHGGAGGVDKSVPDSLKKVYLNALTEALTIGKEILAEGGASLDAVVSVVKFMEDNPNFNAGRGAVFTSEGTHELDASIMNGKDLSCGAAAGVKRVKNPVLLAKLVMEKTPHILFAGEGADKLAEKFGLELTDQNYFHDQRRYEQWLEYKKRIGEQKHGTVGAVALDHYGNLAAATSTGGTTNKMPGRVGDSPIIGAGNYADNKTCAVSGTGHGEKFIKNNVAFNISALMEYKGLSLKDAVNEIVHKRLQPNDGGVIAVDKDGNYVTDFNTKAMFRGAADSKGAFEVKIWE